MKYRWSMAPAQPVLAKFLAKELHISPLLGQCLLNRGLSEPPEIARFLEPRLKDLADPFLLPNMAAGVERLFQARARQEPVVIFGDYDVDGVTATTLLTEVLTAHGWSVSCYLPHRMDEGYGLTQAAVENCLKQCPARVMIAVDCGSTTPATIQWLQVQGIDVLVLDHHQISDPPPQPLALINPKLARKAPEKAGAALNSSRGQAAPVPAFEELCSAGLAFKLAHALVKRGREMGLPEAKAYDVRTLLDLVALGTIADLVPLVGENRILVSSGLARLNETRRPGLCALKQVAQITKTVGAYEVGFQLGPRLNAAGRLETALDSLHLLLAADFAAAMPFAKGLDAQNRSRQEIEKKIAGEVVESVRAKFRPEQDYVIIEGQAGWHIGVVGIVASRVLQEFYRPTLIFGGDGELWRGSGRSIAGLDLAATLCGCTDLLVRHGGHAMAAGVTLEPGKLDAFRARMNELARRALKPEDLQPLLRLDAEVAPGELNMAQMKELRKLEQTGMGNPPVQLVLRNVGHERALRRMGADKQHAKLWLSDGRATYEAVMWGVGDGALPVGRFDLAFAPQLNHYNGSVTIQLKVLDWRPVD